MNKNMEAAGPSGQAHLAQTQPTVDIRYEECTASQNTDFYDDTEAMITEEQRKRKLSDAQDRQDRETNKRSNVKQPGDLQKHNSNMQSQGRNNRQLPINATLNSEGKGNIIIIKPDIEDPKKIINNPVEINKMLKKVPFTNMIESATRVNKRKNLIVIELEESHEVNIKKLEQTKVIAGWPVKCYAPEKEIAKFGVIHPIDPKVSITEIIEAIEIPLESSKLTRVERLKNVQKMDGLTLPP